MKRLFAAAAFAPLCFAAHHAQAQTTISTATSTPVATSTSGNIEITGAGSVTVKEGGPAVTVNSNNTLKADGTISVRDSANGVGIQVNTPVGGLSTGISITGNIAADDTVVNTDTDKDGDLDGAFVPAGAIRYGVRVSGAGPLMGDLTQGVNTIAVEGNQGSTGVLIETGMIGKLTLGGTIGVLGSDTFGVRTLGPIDGTVSIGGVVNAQGQNATGVSLEGPISGLVRFHGTINATGFRYGDNTASPTDPKNFDADDLLIGKSAVVIAGDLYKGLVFDSAPSDRDSTDTDEDDDGILDDVEGSATIRAFGSAPAVLVGGAADMKISPVGVGTFGVFGVQINGQIIGNGVNEGVSGYGARFGGLGGKVEVEGGIRIAGQVNGAAFKANSTGLLFGAGASTPVLLVDTGQISAGASSEAGGLIPTVRALVIEPGADLPRLFNNGTIRAGVNGPRANVSAVMDLSGSLTSITNTGSISAGIITGDIDLEPVGARVALDLRFNSTGVDIVQGANGNPDFVPSITGDILFGPNGNNNISLFAGNSTGVINFGGGDDSLLVGGISRTDLRKSGGVLNLGVAGDLTLTNTNRVDANLLYVSSAGRVTFTADPLNPVASQRATFLNVAGDTTFEKGSKIDLEFKSKLAGPVTFELVRSTKLINQGVDTTLVSDLPFLFTGQARIVENSVVVDVRQRNTTELGLFGGRADAYDAFYAAFDKDPGVARSVFGKTNAADFNKLYDQFLPDYSGGPFVGLANGARAVQQAQAEEAKDMVPGEPRSWLQEVGIGTKFESARDVEYQTGGFGVAAGLERPIIGTTNQVYGFSGAFFSSEIRNDNRALGSLLTGSAVMSSVYWRAQERGMVMDASFSGGYAWFESDRRLVDQNALGFQNLIRQASADWSGAMAAARLGVSYNWEAGPFYVRHDATLDAVYLREGGYTEAGGGAAVNLRVDERENYEAAAEAGILLGARFGRSFRWGPEIRVAYRGVLDGGEGETIGRFASVPGQGFILPGLIRDRQRITIRAALRGSGAYSNFAFEASGDIGEVYQAYMARFIVRFLF